MQLIDLTGQIIGHWTVLSKAPSTGHGARWFVRCSCGTEKILDGYELRTKHSLSCGCRRYEKRTLPTGEGSRRALLGMYRRSALRRKLTWELSDDEFSRLIQEDCHYCGALPSVRKDHSRYNGSLKSNGIDRKNSNKGYQDGNVVACCSLCNQLKGSQDYGIFMQQIRRIARKWGL